MLGEGVRGQAGLFVKVNGNVKGVRQGRGARGGSYGFSGLGVSHGGNPYPISSRTLGTSGLYTGNQSTGVAGGTSATAADNVTIYDPSTGVANTYFFHTSFNQWRKGTTDSSNITIPEGSAIVISRKANRGAFEWYIPQPTF